MLRSAGKRLRKAIPFKRHVFRTLRIFRPPSSVYQHLHFTGPFTVRMDDGRSFKMLSYGDRLENDLFWRPFGFGWEGVSIRAWRRLAEHAHSIADVGANTGAYALIARAVNSQATIVAFEPVDRIADRLEKNVNLNGFDIVTERRAVSDRSTMVDIYDTENPQNYTASLDVRAGVNDRSYKVEAVRMDEYFREKPLLIPELVKIDVERHEPQVIAGMTEILESRPALILEVLEQEVADRIWPYVGDLGYRMFRIDEKGGLYERDTLVPALVEDDCDENLNNLLCTDEQFQRARLNELLRRGH